ncbi:ATP-dependent DNA helicase RRM3-like [Silene latifolia]|uniref:ATP-dependent DNA helicase RRM3-like n=1 Tax=Silene latifolia TaxID=37657 RepID=UPI003D775E32
MDVVRNNRGGVFFVYGYGGMGKNFIWRTLCAALRSRGQIVLPVASSDIAATLLPGEMTANSRLSIPINVVENSTCPRIKPGSDLAELLIRTKRIIWDEAPITHRYAFEAVDRSLRDVMRFSNDEDVNQPFGGKMVVFGSDFRQILPVIPKDSRSEIVNASLCASNLWSICKVLKLTKKNMRLRGGDSCFEVAQIKDFSEWILKVGDREAGDPNDGEVELELSNDIFDSAHFLSGSHKGDKVDIARITFTPSDSGKFPVQFDIRQFPVAVCFAMTINKRQGQSLAHVGLYLPRLGVGSHHLRKGSVLNKLQMCNL